MILGSHNSWTYLPTKKWWMKLLSFTARCQNISIQEQYNLGVRCFDLRVKFTKEGFLKIAHGLIEYKYSTLDLCKDLEWLNKQSDVVYIRVLHEIRKKKEYTKESVEYFRDFLIQSENYFKNLKFWCGRNLYNWNIDYKFSFEPTCEDAYASTTTPNYLDDWWPWLYAFINNKKILNKGTDKDILLIDFVNYGNRQIN